MVTNKKRELALATLIDAARKVADLHRSARIRPVDECPHDLEVSRALGDLTVADYRWRELTESN